MRKGSEVKGGGGMNGNARRKGRDWRRMGGRVRINWRKQERRIKNGKMGEINWTREKK